MKKLIAILMLLFTTFCLTSCQLDINGMLGLPNPEETQADVVPPETKNLDFTLNLYDFYNDKVFYKDVTLQDYFTITDNATFFIGDGKQFENQEKPFYCATNLHFANEKAVGKIILNAPTGGIVEIYLSAESQRQFSCIDCTLNSQKVPIENFATDGEIHKIKFSIQKGEHIFTCPSDLEQISVWRITYIPFENYVVPNDGKYFIDIAQVFPNVDPGKKVPRYFNYNYMSASGYNSYLTTRVDPNFSAKFEDGHVFKKSICMSGFNQFTLNFVTTGTLEIYAEAVGDAVLSLDAYSIGNVCTSEIKQFDGYYYYKTVFRVNVPQIHFLYNRGDYRSNINIFGLNFIPD